MCEKCKDAASDRFVEGIATILWASAWADHAEEHDCCNLSGQEITSIMPPIPEKAWRMAERLAGKIEERNGCTMPVIFAAAMRAEHGKSHEPTHEDYWSKTALRFGECLAWEATGAGVSWYDDHPRFTVPGGKAFKVPRFEDCELRFHADSTCTHETDNKPCAECSAYVPAGKERCPNCGAVQS